LHGVMLLLGIAVDLIWWARSEEAQSSQFHQLSLEQLAHVVAFELQSEDRRPSEGLLSFYEFQDVAEFTCEARMVYLLNATVATREHIQGSHRDVLGLAGMFLELLQAVPQENSWIWLLTNAHRRFLDHVYSYWSRVVTLALDQHHCLIPPVRNVILDAVVAWKQLHVELLSMQWNAFAFGKYREPKPLQQPSSDEATIPQESLALGNMWIEKVGMWFEQYTQTLANVMLSLDAANSGYDGTGATRLHHQDEHGSFVTYEFLRRKVFGQWAIDKGLLRGLLRHVWQPPHGSSAPVSVADFGAGGGHYSIWLNETGLVQAYAFDGTHQAAELTGGAVQEVNLVGDLRLWRNFSWVLCLEVGEHIPQQYASGLLRNLRRHAEAGLVMSWSDDWEGIGHVNCLSRADFVAKVQDETGFVLDQQATEVVKASCEIEYISRTIAVFRRLV